MKIISRRRKKTPGSISYLDVFQQYESPAFEEGHLVAKPKLHSPSPSLGDPSWTNDLLLKHKTNPNPRRQP
jgi:hypothetical protein